MKWTERRECGGAKGRCDDSESFSESRNLSQVSPLNFQPPKKDRNCLGGGVPRQGPQSCWHEDEGNKVVDLSNSNDANDDVGRGDILARENLVYQTIP